MDSDKLIEAISADLGKTLACFVVISLSVWGMSWAFGFAFSWRIVAGVYFARMIFRQAVYVSVANAIKDAKNGR